MANLRAAKIVRPIHRPSGVAGVLASLFALLFAGSMITILLAVAIWPGEVKLVAPLFCSDNQPDAFIVTDTYSVQPGETSTNFTLYCMGPSGDATDHGYFLPFLATMTLNMAILVLLIVLARVIGRLRTRRTRAPEPASADPPQGSTAGPFVD
ncbi:MAG: hypothetical protein ACR2O6_09665 [Ilumatobacteraceae bacterium]